MSDNYMIVMAVMVVDRVCFRGGEKPLGASKNRHLINISCWRSKKKPRCWPIFACTMSWCCRRCHRSFIVRYDRNYRSNRRRQWQNTTQHWEYCIAADLTIRHHIIISIIYQRLSTAEEILKFDCICQLFFGLPFGGSTRTKTNSDKLICFFKLPEISGYIFLGRHPEILEISSRKNKMDGTKDSSNRMNYKWGDGRKMHISVCEFKVKLHI